MPSLAKRRREVRYPLSVPIEVDVLLRSLRRGSSKGVSGVLTDVSKGGMGILVQEHIALETKCQVEVPAGNRIRRFRGEVCYVQRSNDGIKLGIMLLPGSSMSVIDFLEKQGVDVAKPSRQAESPE